MTIQKTEWAAHETMLVYTGRQKQNLDLVPWTKILTNTLSELHTKPTNRTELEQSQ